MKIGRGTRRPDDVTGTELFPRQTVGMSCFWKPQEKRVQCFLCAVEGIWALGPTSVALGLLEEQALQNIHVYKRMF